MESTKSPLVSVHISEAPIDVSDVRGTRPSLSFCGGYASFEGIIRDINEGKTVTGVHYDCYHSLALKELKRITQQAANSKGVGFVEVIHRTGHLEVGEIALFVHAMSKHRQEAFDCCSMIIDELKKTVPIWKKEYYLDGGHAWPRCQRCHST